jgi:ubiquinone/menaquinone biosynthesis C-methylase UbiE
VSAPPAGDHYSYRVYADPATARHFDERRFGGDIGRLVAASQAEVLARFAGPMAGRRVLDVGTGTGRAALLMAQAGAIVTGVDPSEEMLAVARARAGDASLPITFDVGDAHRLAFDSRAFDLVVSFRVLMHVPDWKACLAELCRVADRRVILDYPSARSFACLQAVSRRITHRLGARTEPYRVFHDREIRRELMKGGFRIGSIHRQFVLPIAVHKAIGSARVSTAARALSERTGLLALFGSPVTLVAERWTS